ncbi:hypothetical protein EX30DRAFT_391272, partial [Ascodesmis nigricans]
MLNHLSSLHLLSRPLLIPCLLIPPRRRHLSCSLSPSPRSRRRNNRCLNILPIPPHAPLDPPITRVLFVGRRCSSRSDFVLDTRSVEGRVVVGGCARCVGGWGWWGREGVRGGEVDGGVRGIEGVVVVVGLRREARHHDELDEDREEERDEVVAH